MITERNIQLVLGLFASALVLVFFTVISAIHPVARFPTEVKTVRVAPVEIPVSVPRLTAVALQVAAKAEETYMYPIGDGDTLSKIERDSCNPLDAIMRRNEGNPAILSRDTIIRGKAIVLLKVESCSPELLAKAKAFPENSPRLEVRGGSPKASYAIGPRERQARKTPGVRIASSKHDVSRVQGYQLATAPNDLCWKLGPGLSIDRNQTITQRAKCIERKYGETIRAAISVIDPRLNFYDVVAILYIESQGNPLAVNVRTDCHGLAGLQTGTARHFGVKHIHDPTENIFGGVRVVSNYIYTVFGGSRAHGITGYNMGPWNKHFPKDPSHYWYFAEVEHIRSLIEPKRRESVRDYA